MFKHIFIKNRSHLYYKNNSLGIKNDDFDTTISLDDIDMLIVENQQTTITSSLLSHLAQKNICTVFVDEKYMPSSINIPLYKNSRVSLVQKAQQKVSKPKHNQLWKQIIFAKIKHQSFVLEKYKKSKAIDGLWHKVTSADKTNIEALAANIYFPELFGKEFTRRDDSVINAALNYGYSIIRSSIARYIIAYGINPTNGIFHSSQLNNFNLADDFIEVFRPVVDEFVHCNIKSKSFGWEEKKKFSVLLYEYELFNIEEERKISLDNAIKTVVASYQSFCLGKRENINIAKMI
ncbi:type II CRISPR-associated endonuclease Cas1 [Sulfurimonas lithotrophica]|uniref:CRISPR-associated endonuclease Cas1 n=1 Tax=Sulfurimonas lithotrophica TaxID=2590022 RepID=A0A5P8P397_9BACT|nr:type II CRISPR-associated endonuclease Cas1 [Sulfurimonas lithotrophica]QFR50164.1 type II CRISPR-associated endonuclease Cas1 [Sulfurimonas lithotrophica]